LGLTRLADPQVASWAWLGGSFDPPHLGHLALAHAAKLALGLDRLSFLPTGQSWQKQATRASSPLRQPSAAQRVAMLEHLIPRVDRSVFTIDTREIERFEKTKQATFSIDTVRELALQYPHERRVLILGADQLRNLASWKSYDALLDYVHLAVTTRPGFGLRDLPEPVDELVRRYGRDSLPSSKQGHIVFFSMSPVPISSTLLRQELALWLAQTQGRATTGTEWATLERFLGKALLDYIEEHRLYGPIPEASNQDPKRSN